MAEAITIACPECDKKITVAAEAAGKKIRCKGCEHVFVVQAPGATAGAKPKGKAAPVKAPGGKNAGVKAAEIKKKAPDAKPDKGKPAKPKADEDEEDNNPYGVTSLDTAPRCPNCANEMESEEAVICLTCGYNTRTRERIESRAVEDVTGMTWFLWLLPGVLCAILTFASLFIAIHSLLLRTVDFEDSWWAYIVTSPATKIWRAVLWLFIAFFSARFAVKRLIYHPRPPERVKQKGKTEEDED